MTETSVSTTVTPHDPELPYATTFIAKDYYDLIIGSDEALFSLLLQTFSTAAERSGMSLEEYLAQPGVLLTGEKPSSMSNLEVDTSYYVFAVGISSKGEQTTDLIKELVTTEKVVMTDMDFDIGYDIKGAVVNMKVTPSNDTQYYTYNVTKKLNLDIEQILEVYQKSILGEIQANCNITGKTPEEVVATVIGSKGVDGIELELEPDTEYYGFAVGMTDRGVFNTEPTVTTFTTGALQMSDNVIGISFPAVGERSVEWATTTTNDDPYYYAMVEAYTTEGMTDGEIMGALLADSGRIFTVKGDQKGRLRYLTPQTEYEFLAFGCVSGRPTTQLFRAKFTTPEAVLGKASFTIRHDLYYDGNEMADTWPDAYQAFLIKDKVVLPVSVQLKGEAKNIYYHIFYGDMTDPDASDVSDEYLIKTLTQQGYTGIYNTFYLDYDKTYTLAGVAVDQEDHYGPVYRESLILTRDGVAPIEGFVPLPESLHSSQMQSPLRYKDFTAWGEDSCFRRIVAVPSDASAVRNPVSFARLINLK